jgi:hypothetical protein
MMTSMDGNHRFISARAEESQRGRWLQARVQAVEKVSERMETKWEVEDREDTEGKAAPRLTAAFVAGLSDGEELYRVVGRLHRLGSSDEIPLSGAQLLSLEKYRVSSVTAAPL